MPLPSTMTPIATNTLTSTVSSITFSSIPQGYTDLVIVANAATAKVSQDFGWLYFNNDTTAGNYSRTGVSGDGTSAASARFSNLIPFTFDTTIRANQTVHIMNYSNSTTYKTSLFRDNNSTLTGLGVGLWRNTAAINTITITGYSANILAGSTFTLYGIKAA